MAPAAGVKSGEVKGGQPTTIREFVAAKGYKPEATSELIFDGLRLKTLSAEDALALQSFPQLKLLSLNKCYLTDISQLPLLPSLEELELHDNKLQGPDVVHTIVARCPNIQGLYMAANRFTEFEHFLPLKELPELRDLDLEMNPLFQKAANNDVLQRQFFEMLPRLRSLNARDRLGREIDDISDEEGMGEGEDSESDSAWVAPDHDEMGMADNDNDNDPNVIRFENDDEESGNNQPSKSLLAEFMEKDYGDDDDEDEEDFNPDSYSEDSEDIQDEDLTDDEEASDQDATSDDTGGDAAVAAAENGTAAPAEEADLAQAGPAKKRRT